MKKTNSKTKKEVRRIFCKFGRCVVKIDHVEKRGCVEYGPTMNANPPNCVVCKHGASLMLDGSLTDAQKKMIAESRRPASVPVYVGGDM